MPSSMQRTMSCRSLTGVSRWLKNLVVAPLMASIAEEAQQAIPIFHQACSLQLCVSEEAEHYQQAAHAPAHISMSMHQPASSLSQ